MVSFNPLLIYFVSFFLLNLLGCHFTQTALYSQEKHKFTNRLAKESSPYLLQHQHNPVDWYPWGEEAFTKARQENKPVLVSIGYSTCHWCHVMERESFESETVAAILNKHFVSIKVDREERPDIDNIYMTFVQRTTGSGGWPLNVFLTPDQKPFYGGTYFPPETRYGRAGFKDVLSKIIELWTTHQQDLLNDAEQMAHLLNQISKETISTETINATPLEIAYQQFEESFDKDFGGFYEAPKFPRPHTLSFLLRYANRGQQTKALEITEKTFRHMQCGGIYDHLGGGFHRYSTDREWLLPHFEKMLYDQALISRTLLELIQITHSPQMKSLCRDIFDYVLRDMTSPEGGFYSAEDADSEGVEGKFYVWTSTEIDAILGKEESAFFSKIYQVVPEGNFYEEASGHKTGANILYLKKPLPEIAQELGVSFEALDARLKSSREKLFQIREKRIHPLKDDKILTDWNALMITSLALGGEVLKEPKYLNAAKKSARFLIEKMWTQKDLLHRYRNGQAGISGYLDDYAFLGLALLELYEITREEVWLSHSIHISEKMIDLFWDKTHGGFYFSSQTQNQLITNIKELYDGAIPSGNSVATLLLLKLGRLTQNKERESIAQKNLQYYWNALKISPTGYPFMLQALDFYLGPSYEIIFAGKREDATLSAMSSALFSKFLPNKVVAFHPEGAESSTIETLIPFIQNQKAQDQRTTVYVCQNYNCQLPTTDIEQMLRLLEKK